MAVRNKELDIYTATKIVLKGGRRQGLRGIRSRTKTTAHHLGKFNNTHIKKKHYYIFTRIHQTY